MVIHVGAFRAEFLANTTSEPLRREPTHSIEAGNIAAIPLVFHGHP